MDAPVEREIKLRMAGPEAARAAVERLGARLERPRHLEDNVLFDDPRASLAAAGRVLRLRRTPDAAVVTFKAPDRTEQGVKSREEIEVTVSDADAFERILEGIGFRRVFRYQKYRETYDWEDVEIVVDETPIGTFLEIEGPAEGIHRAAAALGAGPADYVTDSYPRLFTAAGGTGDMVFR